MNSTSNITIFPKSMQTGQFGSSSITCFLGQDEESGEVILGVRLAAGESLPGFTGLLTARDGDRLYALTPENAAILRSIFAWLKPVPLEQDTNQRPSFGFGDRLGLATPGHIQALLAVCSPPVIAPIFAQQSVRENARTGRTPQEVMDDALWGVLREGWQLPWGADADHLKQTSDLAVFVESGYTFFTIDPGEYVDPAADTDTTEVLLQKTAGQSWAELETQAISQAELVSGYLAFCGKAGLACDEQALLTAALRAAAKYGKAILHIAKMYRALLALKPAGFDFEVSVDETDSPTNVLEHFYIASELKRLGVRFTSLAPRLLGRFEKGVDYIGDLDALEAELVWHIAVMEHIGGYKLSLHSGSDKFSLYPLLVRHAGKALHVKTAGTSYLEALRVAAWLDPHLFKQVLALACERYPQERVSYHVSADVQVLPDPDGLEDSALPDLLDNFHVRQALHVTFGSALAQHGTALKALLRAHPAAYEQVLLDHFKRHLEPLLHA